MEKLSSMMRGGCGIEERIKWGTSETKVTTDILRREVTVDIEYSDISLKVSKILENLLIHLYASVNVLLDGNRAERYKRLFNDSFLSNQIKGCLINPFDVRKNFSKKLSFFATEAIEIFSGDQYCHSMRGHLEKISINVSDDLSDVLCISDVNKFPAKNSFFLITNVDLFMD